eukprot:4899827-Amphidinium_carterae.1
MKVVGIKGYFRGFALLQELEHPTPCGKKGETLHQMFLMDGETACSPASKSSPARRLQLPEEALDFLGVLHLTSTPLQELPIQH